MKTWTLMYLLIWVAFLQMALALFPALGLGVNLDLHFVVGLCVVALAWHVSLRVRRTACPDRIKRITRATAYLSVFAGILGIILYLNYRSVLSLPFQEVVVFVHFGTAVAIITQASASAAAFDMWEEKEFVTPTDSKVSP